MNTAVLFPPTCDLCDANESLLDDGRLRVLPPGLRAFGRRTAFAGPVATLRVWEDNTLVRAELEKAGQGRVLVIDGGASLRCALVGGNLGQLAVANGWAGVVVWGCVRDADELDGCDVGFRAIATNPRKSRKNGGTGGARDIALEIGGAAVRPGNWCYVDADGVLFSDNALHG